MKIVCDACAAKYSIADEKVAGKVFKIRCKKCSNIIVVRGKTEAAEVEVAEPEPSTATKVFDYEAGGSNAEEWHVVIDQEQVGPLSTDEVRHRYATGQIDSDTYIWKEGFADWERLPDVANFADLTGTEQAALPDQADSGMFGSAAASGSADLFGGDSGGGADLFGGGSDAGSADLFGGGQEAPQPEVGEHTAQVSLHQEAEAQLKGQRNENSVLFSLGNLAALASDSPKAVARTGASPSASMNTGGSEGSGLIDIRSMASVYLADRGNATAAPIATGSADDLPVFSTSAFEHASPVLLPTQSSGRDNKFIALVGMVAVLGVAVIVVAVMILKKGDEQPRQLAAAAPEPIAEKADTVSDMNPGTVPKTVPDAVPDVPAATAVPDTTAETPSEITEDGERNPEPTKTGKNDRRKPERKSDRKTSKPKVSASKPKVRSKPDAAKPSKSNESCDEVSCLISPDEPCCRKYKKKSSGSNSNSSPSSILPTSPERGDIVSGIGKIKGRVTACGRHASGGEKVNVEFKIGSNGKVSSAKGSGGSSALNSCVASAVKRAKFPKTQKGLSVKKYPFKF